LTSIENKMIESESEFSRVTAAIEEKAKEVRESAARLREGLAAAEQAHEDDDDEDNQETSRELLDIMKRHLDLLDRLYADVIQGVLLSNANTTALHRTMAGLVAVLRLALPPAVAAANTDDAMEVDTAVA
jgi:hypothetical protein